MHSGTIAVLRTHISPYIHSRTAYQSLHKSQACHFNNGLTHRWLEYYRNVKYRSNQICINEWNQMDEIISHHPHFTHPFVSPRHFSPFNPKIN